MLVFNDDQKKALTGMIIGAVVIVASEIGIIVLKNIFCKDISIESRTAVLTGASKTRDEKVAEAQKILAEAQATVKAAEAATAAAEAEKAEETQNK